MRYIVLFLILLIGLNYFTSCKKKSGEIKPFALTYDASFPAPVYTFANNKLTYQRFLLGKYLFYEKGLSSDSSISCATCHEQNHAFGPHNSAFSAGVNGQLGTRNAPALFNLIWNPTFMWDGGINHIETMPLAPITNPVEMNESMSNVISKLQQSDDYKDLFKKAYGSSTVTDQRVFQALACFMGMLVSDQSKYDQVKRGLATFTANESAGYLLFQQKCSSCHSEPLFTDYSYRNNGLDDSFTDLGRGLITQEPSDYGKFKVPSLRNVAFTYPYMHDGRFYTLNQVLEHYRSGIVQSTTLDPLIASGIPLTNTEKIQLIAFLKTLSDYQLISNTLFYEPVHE
jgi:cytochrome c peroxidase